MSDPTGAQTPASRKLLGVVGIGCALYGAFCAAVYAVNLSQQPGSDFMVYYTAARAWLDGNLGLLYDGERLTAYLNTDFAAWLAKPLTYHAWVYPPHYLLLLIPFGLLPYAWAYAAFIAITLAALLAAIWLWLARPGEILFYAAALMLSPAALFDVGTGQNAFLTTAFLVAGFGLLPSRPLVGGMLLGLLTYKPQFWLMVPVALVAAHAWRAILGGVIGGVAALCLSAAVIGVDAWRHWIIWAMSPPDAAYQVWVETARLHGEAIYTNLISLGAPVVVASAGQWLAVLASASCVGWCFSRTMPHDLRIAVVLAATFLAAPHVANYDAVLVVVAASVVVARGLADGFRRGELLIPLAAWMIQLFNPPT
ncbi:MAG: DUF2029 domain-containing protein, partial [Alphaproteobacteria bacterium]|nr:DUF2029 domain-containing protein [Alphaproteobacteria bacterium]